MYTTRFDIGILYCSKVRDFLKSLSFQGYDIDFIEGSGWLSRIFTIRSSNEAHLLMAHQSIVNYFDKIRSED